MNQFSFSLTWRSAILISSLFMVLGTNGTFFSHILSTYGLSDSTFLPVVSLGFVLWGVLVIVLALFGFGRTTKALLIILFMISSQTAYFMDAYDVVIDENMLQNAMETNINETLDLLSLRQFGYFAFFGLIPSWFIFRAEIEPLSTKRLWIEKGKMVGIALISIIVIIFSFNKFYTSFFREHKPLRYYTNPAYPLYSIIKSVSSRFTSSYEGVEAIGTDAKIIRQNEMRKLVILVVGEAARADHFSLNGYARETNPLLKKEDIIRFSDVSSCGTETAVSVPCMFSKFGRSEYDKDKAKHTENVLDVLAHAGVNVLWRDNNSDSKGVATRVTYEDFKQANNNSVCDEECRDEGMLIGLDKYIQEHPHGDIIIVLHQMGNHGPAYYKRYPKAYEVFTPTCKTNQLEACSETEIGNAYDNAIVYTDAFLTKVIGFLKQQEKFQTGMIYLSDHGESLGENGLYLHGFPYAIAPDAQKKVPMIMWFGETFDIDQKQLKKQTALSYDHDNLFHSLLGIFEVQTTQYQPQKDIFHGLR